MLVLSLPCLVSVNDHDENKSVVFQGVVILLHRTEWNEVCPARGMRAWVQAANGPCGLECILEFFFLMIDKNRQTQTYTMPCPCQNVAITGPGGLGASAQKARHVHRQHWPTRPPPPTVRGA